MIAPTAQTMGVRMLGASTVRDRLSNTIADAIDLELTNLEPNTSQAALSLMTSGMLILRIARKPGIWLTRATTTMASEAQTKVIGFT